MVLYNRLSTLKHIVTIKGKIYNYMHFRTYAQVRPQWLILTSAGYLTALKLLQLYLAQLKLKDSAGNRFLYFYTNIIYTHTNIYYKYIKLKQGKNKLKKKRCNVPSSRNFNDHRPHKWEIFTAYKLITEMKLSKNAKWTVCRQY